MGGGGKETERKEVRLEVPFKDEGVRGDAGVTVGGNSMIN